MQLFRGVGEGYKRLTGTLSRDQNLEVCQSVRRGKEHDSPAAAATGVEVVKVGGGEGSITSGLD